MLANCLFSRDPERPFDTERPRNWGSFGAELNGLKPWRRGGFRCFLGGWLVVENASKLSVIFTELLVTCFSRSSVDKESKLSQLTIQRAGNETLRTGTDLDTGKKRRFQKSNL